VTETAWDVEAQVVVVFVSTIVMPTDPVEGARIVAWFVPAPELTVPPVTCQS
jgi:hypothetical protein